MIVFRLIEHALKPHTHDLCWSNDLLFDIQINSYKLTKIHNFWANICCMELNTDKLWFIIIIFFVDLCSHIYNFKMNADFVFMSSMVSWHCLARKAEYYGNINQSTAYLYIFESLTRYGLVWWFWTTVTKNLWLRKKRTWNNDDDSNDDVDADEDYASADGLRMIANEWCYRQSYR